MWGLPIPKVVVGEEEEEQTQASHHIGWEEAEEEEGVRESYMHSGYGGGRGSRVLLRNLLPG